MSDQRFLRRSTQCLMLFTVFSLLLPHCFTAPVADGGVEISGSYARAVVFTPVPETTTIEPVTTPLVAMNLTEPTSSVMEVTTVASQPTDVTHDSVVSASNQDAEIVIQTSSTSNSSSTTHSQEQLSSASTSTEAEIPITTLMETQTEAITEFVEEISTAPTIIVEISPENPVTSPSVSKIDTPITTSSTEPSINVQVSNNVKSSVVSTESSDIQTTTEISSDSEETTTEIVVVITESPKPRHVEETIETIISNDIDEESLEKEVEKVAKGVADVVNSIINETEKEKQDIASSESKSTEIFDVYLGPVTTNIKEELETTTGIIDFKTEEIIAEKEVDDEMTTEMPILFGKILEDSSTEMSTESPLVSAEEGSTTIFEALMNEEISTEVSTVSARSEMSEPEVEESIEARTISDEQSTEVPKQGETKTINSEPKIEGETTAVPEQAETRNSEQKMEEETTKVPEQTKERISEPKVEGETTNVSEETEARSSEPKVVEETTKVPEQTKERISEPKVEGETTEVPEQTETRSSEPKVEGETTKVPELTEARNSEPKMEGETTKVPEQTEARNSEPKVEWETPKVPEQTETNTTNSEIKIEEEITEIPNETKTKKSAPKIEEPTTEVSEQAKAKNSEQEVKMEEPTTEVSENQEIVIMKKETTEATSDASTIEQRTVDIETTTETDETQTTIIVETSSTSTTTTTTTTTTSSPPQLTTETTVEPPKSSSESTIQSKQTEDSSNGMRLVNLRAEPEKNETIPEIGVDNDDEIKLCSSNECQIQAKKIRETIDETINPCDNFYEYACGNFGKTIDPVTFGGTVRAIDLIQEEINSKLEMILQEPPTASDIVPYSVAKRLYHLCTKDDTNNENKNRLLKILESFGGWPILVGTKWTSVEDSKWTSITKKLKDFGQSTNYVVTLSVAADLVNASQFVMKVEPTLTILGKQHSAETHKYKTYMLAISKYFGENSMDEKEIDEIIDFEVELQKLITSSADSPRIVALKDLDTEFKFLDWFDFITASLPYSTVINVNDEVIVQSPQYMKGLDGFLSSTSPRTISNYVIWRFVEWSSKFMSPQLRSLWSNYHNTKLTCIDLIRKTIPIISSSIYANRYLTDDNEMDVKEIFEDFDVTADLALGYLPWIDTTTKVIASKWKSDAPRKFRVAKELNESFVSSFYNTLHAYDQTLFGTVLKINKFTTMQQFSYLRQSTDTDWTKSIDLVNVASYQPVNDFPIAIPATLVQGQLSAGNDTKVINYATVLSQFSRFFIVRFLDIHSDGNFGLFWSNTTKENFEKHLPCTVQQYSNFSTEYGRVNGDLSKLDNLVDIGMFRIADIAFKILGDTESKRLPGVVYNSPRQIFWTKAAQTFCTKYTGEALKKVVTDGKTPAKFRINGAVMNLVDFSRDFNCRAGSAMNPKNEERCINVWDQ